MSKLLKQAFTLIELLVVIAIIGILSGLIVVSMGGITAKANVAKSQVFANSLKNSLMLNLVSEWKLDENTGTATADSWSGANTGTLIGATHLPTWKTDSNCINGSCVQFDGVDDYIDFGIGSSLNIVNAITIGAWIKTISNNNQPIVSRGLTGSTDHTWNFFVSSGYPTFYWANGYSFGAGDFVAGNATVNDNKWHYVIAEATGTKINIYIDGVLNNSTTKATKPNSNLTLKVVVGRILGYTDYWFNGLIDEVRIYKTSMSAYQIKEQYYSGLNSLFTKGEILKEDYQQRLAEIQNKTARK